MPETPGRDGLTDSERARLKLLKQGDGSPKAKAELAKIDRLRRRRLGRDKGSS